MIKDIYLENLLTEDGHEDVPSAIRKLKTSIEDCQEIIQKLESVGDIELPTWWMGKVIESSDRLNKARDYILNSELTEAPLNSPSQLPFSSTEAQKFVEKDVRDMGKLINQASAKSIKIMMNGVKGGRYDAMDLIRGIKSGPAMDTSVGVREMLQVLWRKVEKRYRNYLGGKKRR